MNFGPPIRPHRNHFFLGLDLGQRCDRSALVILERVHELTGEFNYANYTRETATRIYLRHAERLPLNFPYLGIPGVIQAILPRLDPQFFHSAPTPKTLVVDATGVGAPVVEIIHHARLQASILPITITSGAAPHGNNVPREVLLSNLRILLESGALRLISGLAESRQLIRELISVSLHAPRAGHDDLAFALALAAWPSASSVLGALASPAAHNLLHTPRGSPFIRHRHGVDSYLDGL